MDGALTLNVVAEDDGQKRKRPEEESDVNVRPAKVKRKLREPDGGGGQNDKPFISSLFRHNPEVPKLAPADVAPAKERIFTGRCFADVGLHPYLVKNLKDSCDIEAMTAVQAKAIPAVLAGRDALIKSQTGSGKTLAYALPILHRLQEMQPPVQRADGVLALVIVPTRELAVQSFEWFEKLCHSFARIVPGVLVGGEKKKSEKSRLRKGINVLISTPGRLLDHLKHTKCLSLGALRWLVLDEADRMLELGYERDVQAITDVIGEQQQTSSVRQTLLLSATLTSGIEQLSEVSLRHPLFVDAAAEEEGSIEAMKRLTTPDNLVQTFGVVPAKLRLVTLAAFILWKCRRRKEGHRKMLIFMATQDMVDFHGELLDRCLNWSGDSEDDSNRHVEFLRLHGSMSQADRMRVFKAFREATSGVLLCTDVAARGLDLPQVDWIVQYNAPVTRADYVHRVGRTARIGAKGSSLLALLPSEANFVRELEQENLSLAEMTVELVLGKLMTMKDEVLLRGHHGRPPVTMEEAATNLQIRMEEAVAGDEGLHGQGSQAYVSFVRSYASYPKEVREIFCFKELHLGHLAKSFALRDAPSKITGLGKGQWVRNDERKRRKEETASAAKREENVIRAQKKRINQKRLVLSEFDAGFDGLHALSASAKPQKSSLSKKELRRKKSKKW